MQGGARSAKRRPPICFAASSAFAAGNHMYITLSKQPRKTKRGKTARFRAKLKRKQTKRVKRMIT